METLNIHLPNLYHLINRIIKELQKSQSSNASMLNDHDVERWIKFFSAIRATTDIIGVPGKLDLPESDPVTYPLRPLHELQDVENQTVAQLSLYMKTLAIELIRSQSSRNSSGLSDPDRKRVLDMVDEMERFLEAARQIQPLDLVESSPRAPIQGQGLNTLGNK